MKKPCVLVLDQGTTNLKAFVFDITGHTIATARQEAPQIFPKPGWVEQDPELIVQAALKISRDAMQMAAARNFEICALGVTNQTESIVLWEKGAYFHICITGKSGGSTHLLLHLCLYCLKWHDELYR